MSNKANKDTNGKPDLSLIPFVFEAAVARVMMGGADKYGRYNYAKGHSISEIVAAQKRHAAKILAGEDVDSESGESHFAHIAAGSLMALHQQDLGTLRDDRFKPDLVNIAWELWVQGGTGKDAHLGTYNTVAEVIIALRKAVPEWPTFTLYIKATTNGHSQTV